MGYRGLSQPFGIAIPILVLSRRAAAGLGVVRVAVATATVAAALALAPALAAAMAPQAALWRLAIPATERVTVLVPWGLPVPMCLRVASRGPRSARSGVKIPYLSL